MIVDAGPFIDAERVNSRFYALIRAAIERGEELHTSHGVLGQVVRDPARQASLLRALRAFDVHSLDDGTSIGRRLATSNTSDVVDGHLAVLADRLDTFIVTSDPDDMTKLGAAHERY